MKTICVYIKKKRFVFCLYCNFMFVGSRSFVWNAAEKKKKKKKRKKRKSSFSFIIHGYPE